METVDQILARAEEETGPPPEPQEGIPKQWLPGWIRWPIRVLAMPLILMDLYAQKVATWALRPPYRQVGACRKRGNCCHYILIPEAKGWMGKFAFFVYTQIYGFYPRYPEPHLYEGKRIQVMGCRYLKKGGSCSHYRLRPTVCRKWPLIAHFGRPRVLKGCGFQAVPRTDRLKVL
jgi:hypothetical protein